MKKLFALLIICFFLSCGGGGSDDTPPTNPTTPTDDDYSGCITAVGSETLEVVTWNIENYPQTTSTREAVLDIIGEMNPDVIAIQELTSQAQFSELLSGLTGWSGGIVQFNGSNLMLGYLFKNSEVTIITQPENIFEEDTEENDDAFTAFRRPLLTKIRHMNGMEVTLINVHLKCCDGSEDRRRLASQKIKSYIDDNLPTENVVVLGDFNDEIVDMDDNVFQNFIDDAANYQFATMAIAMGGSTGWSFPSWPSHIDQILITDELFERVLATEVLALDLCSTSYSNQVSDHRPVLMRLSNE